MTMCSAESTPDPNNGGSVTKTPDATSRNPNRRSNKPIMEKRRRARINNCLNELKGILLEAMRKDPARHSKLEKADILELTVSHLKALHRHHSSSSSGSSNSGDSSRFRAGFAECAAEVGRFLSSSKPEGIDPQTSGRLLSHLADCINNPSLGGSPPMNNINSHPTHTPLSSLEGGGNVTTTLNVGPNTPIISLVPSRLSSGEIAFVVPGFNSSAAAAAAAAAAAQHQHQHQHQHHLRGANTPSSAISLTMQSTLHCNPPPMLSPEVPLELTVSSSSSSGCSLSPNYPIGNGHSHLHHHHHQHHHQQQQQPHPHPHPPTFHQQHKLGSYSPALPPSTQPLALVTPKKEEQDGNCWRPWW